MIRLFLPREKLSSEQIIIDGKEARYLSLVLRAKQGDTLTILDGQGCRYICKITKVHKKKVIAEKIKTEIYSVESPISIVVAQGVPKGDKMDFIVQKSTELGVKKIIPLITERSQVRYTAKSERWRKIAISASQQSGREKIPEVFEPLGFEDFLNKYNTLSCPLSLRETVRGRGIIFSEEKKERNLKKILQRFKGTTEITLLIGPEGGFSDVEISTAAERNFVAASLGPRILRTETAPITALSIIQYELGDM